MTSTFDLDEKTFVVDLHTSKMLTGHVKKIEMVSTSLRELGGTDLHVGDVVEIVTVMLDDSKLCCEARVLPVRGTAGFPPFVRFLAAKSVETLLPYKEKNEKTTKKS